MSTITKALAAQSPLIVDGAMATELEKRRVDTANELWSAMALIHDPQAVRSVHLSYFEAGANIAITDTYQANIPAFERIGLSAAEARQLISAAAREALTARDAYRAFDPGLEAASGGPGRPLLVAGSIGPYGAFLADGSEYTGAYTLADAQYRDFHRERMRILADAGVDLFAFETMPNMGEVRALVGLLAEEFPGREAWVSFSLHDDGHLCDGTPLEEAAAKLDGFVQISAIGVNCVPLDMVTAAIRRIRMGTSKPIIVYPNNGDIYHPDTKTWTPNPSGLSLAQLAPQWIAAGASLIGGCCRTTPEDIRRLSASL
ncbi:homocysteine S-methyltransferase [Bifidobacterium vansinderenii]|uniref:S-methylmethionine:homocysteine methyltransferase n=1 Tax=Bifidobacterium vansinderenii TaxID=1984871 RepID=A0A229VVI7_9BIFI|nr:homocysteine S-methyltransferase [Bifidobacterium vansinderenii]OXM99633.1 homocysteine methyltransferase [Bifidobacterium vansinderenii]